MPVGRHRLDVERGLSFRAALRRHIVESREYSGILIAGLNDLIDIRNGWRTGQARAASVRDEYEDIQRLNFSGSTIGTEALV